MDIPVSTLWGRANWLQNHQLDHHSQRTSNELMIQYARWSQNAALVSFMLEYNEEYDAWNVNLGPESVAPMR